MQKKIFSIILSVIFLFDIVSAKEVNVNSEKYIIYNMNDNRIIDEKNSNDKTYIASLTKIMTAIVSIENIEDYDKKVTITHEMIDGIAWDVSVVGFKVGEELTYNDLLYGTLLNSGADAVNALAVSVGGSIDNFVKMMNDKANELNLETTHFANPVGLTDKENYSSAADVAKLLIYALKNEKFKNVFETRSTTLTNGKKSQSTIEGYNKKSGSDISYITGAKTGYTKASGYCLATTATINDIDYLLVTLNAHDDSTQHIKDTTKIYDYFSDNYDYRNIVSEDDVVVTLDTILSKEDKIDIVAGVSKEYYLKNDFNKKDIIYEYDGVKEISYFTKAGTKLGTVKVKYNNEVLSEFDLIYNQTLSFSLISFIVYYKVYVIIVLIIVLLFYCKKKRRKRKKSNL